MAIYLEYEGIKGNVTAGGYTDHIKFDSFNFGIGRPISMEPGNLGNREKTKPSISEITLTKVADGSTTSLFKESVAGTTGKTVKIKFVHTGGEEVTQYMDYELSECLVSGYSISADSEGDPVENITLSFSKVLFNYTDADSSGKAGTPKRVGYDLAAAKSV